MVAFPQTYHYPTNGPDDIRGATDVSDFFVFTAGDQANSGDIFSGGGNSPAPDTIQIEGPLQLGTAGIDFRNIERLEFTNPPLVAISGITPFQVQGATVTFSATQFVGGKISQSLLLNSFAGDATVVVEVSQNFSAAGWQFGTWD